MGSAGRGAGFSHQERTWRSIEATRPMGTDERGAMCPGLGTSPRAICRLSHIDMGTAAEVGSRVSQQRVGPSGDIILDLWRRHTPEWWRTYQKQSPRIARNAPGLLMSRRGAGERGQRDTHASIGTSWSAAKSSVGYRVTGAANEGVVHEEGLMA